MHVVPFEVLLARYPPAYFHELSSFGALSQETLLTLLREGTVTQFERTEVVYPFGAKVTGFNVILSGSLSLFFPSDEALALTRVYSRGEQIGFVGMIALHDRKGTAIANETALVLEITAEQFFGLYDTAPQDFGLLLLNLSREMARSIGDMGETIRGLRQQLATQDKGHPGDPAR